MRAVFYLVGVLIMLAAGMGMALLPRLIPDLWLFLLAGGVLTGAIFTGWLLLGATAGSWPRLRTGQVLTATGFVALGISLWDSDGTAVLWSGLVILTGVAFSYPLLQARRGRRNPSAPRGPVRPPLGRREPN